MTLIPQANLPDVSVLNCGAGDMTFSFDEKDALESARAERVITDMLQRGYLLFALVKGKHRRVTEFDPKTHEYIIADGATAQPAESKPEPMKKPTTKKKPSRVPAKGTPVTGIAPRAGG